LSGAWERVIALVVQPGVEFGVDVVFSYDREKARLLSSVLPKDSSIVYEAHSTDYQSTQALNELVEDHFAIVKVGPWLRFAFREAIFALSAMERELLGGNKAIRLSEVRQALENAMLRNPSHWRSYYHGDEAKQRFSRAYSYKLAVATIGMGRKCRKKSDSF
jgi:D-tagatose-1,6-bisphosphate aldolase subunit GatZ/KbaZ